eukprot:3966867-Prymnesium_polylepis.1
MLNGCTSSAPRRLSMLLALAAGRAAAFMVLCVVRWCHSRSAPQHAASHARTCSGPDEGVKGWRARIGGDDCLGGSQEGDSNGTQLLHTHTNRETG